MSDADLPPFSLLLPVYAGDSEGFLERAFFSAVRDQTLQPAQVVIVQDGPVSAGIAAIIDGFVRDDPERVDHVELKDNVGLAQALTVGIGRCRHEVIARMDADDISLPDRFRLQVAHLVENDLDLVGAGMFEFADDTGKLLGKRVPPRGSTEIARYARFHDPFNHPTVVYRKAAVLRAGGYLPLGLMEDYWLFARMIHTGARVDNLTAPLVMYRVGAGAYHRRGGMRQLSSELRLQRQLRRIGFTSSIECLRNVAVRGGYRLVPVGLRRRAYRRVFAQPPDEGTTSVG